jgi:hypothetical protein
MFWSDYDFIRKFLQETAKNDLMFFSMVVEWNPSYAMLLTRSLLVSYMYEAPC